MRAGTDQRVGLHAGRVPARAWTLALIDVAGAVSLLAVSVSRLGPGVPAAVKLSCAAALLLAAAAALALGGRIGDRALLCLASTRVLVVALLVSEAADAAQALAACFGLVAVTTWSAAFLRPRALLSMLGVELVAMLTAVALNHEHARTLVDVTGVLLISGAGGVLLSRMMVGLRSDAHQDQLTGLLNRHGLEAALRSPSRGGRTATPASIVVLDLDNLKAVNDQGGHLAGDRLLVAFASELMGAAHYGDHLARLGGDEFIVVLPGRSSAEAASWAEALGARSRIARSHGVSERRPDDTLESWLERADRRMYEAKALRRCRRQARLAAV